MHRLQRLTLGKWRWLGVVSVVALVYVWWGEHLTLLDLNVKDEATKKMFLEASQE
jgi:hypothetical protein